MYSGLILAMRIVGGRDRIDPIRKLQRSTLNQESLQFQTV
jgi:hypothetical protein